MSHAATQHHSPAESVGKKNDRYLYGVDLVRFGAAMSVALFHFAWHHAGIESLAWFGWAGVQVFFVISGFVIANSAKDSTALEFLRSRALRLYPTAFVCAGLTFLTYASINLVRSTGGNVRLFWEFLGSAAISPAGPFIAGAYWTLPIELSFYMMIFALLLANAFDRIGQFALVLTGASTVYLCVYSLHVFGAIVWPALELGYGMWTMTLLRHGIYFALGIFFWKWSVGKLRFLEGAAAGVAALAALLEISCRSKEILASLIAPSPLSQVWLLPISLWGLSCVAIICSVIWCDRFTSLAPHWRRMLRVIGLTTYPFYLLHDPIGSTLEHIMSHMGRPLLTGIAVGIAGALFVSVLVATRLEPPVRKYLEALLRHLFYQPRAT